MVKIAQRGSRTKKIEQVETTREGYLPHDLQRLINALDMELLVYLRPLNFSPQQYRVLQIVAQLEPISVGDVARLAVIEQSVVSRMIDQLRARKLLSKAKRPDNGRVVDVRVTDMGRKIANQIQPIAEAIVDDATAIISEEERATLVRTLSKIFRHVTSPPQPEEAEQAQTEPAVT